MIEKTNGKKHILLVDDDRSITQTLTLLLRTRGYEVEIAFCGGEVFDKITDTTDLILLDLMLPDRGGLEVCRRLKEDKMTRSIPVIILSGKLLSGDIVEGLYLGADDYLTKPFEYEELVARMEAVMRRGLVFRSGGLAGDGGESVICEIRRIIDEELITPFFQPVFLLKPFQLFGFEALSRPVTNNMLSNPELLFKAAVQYGFYQELEILSWKKAIECAATFLDDKKLFLNCNPYLVEGPKFPTINALFERSHLNVENVILEITERSAISDFKVFYECLHQYRRRGFKFAVDDVGGGYASLEAIIETKPEVVKIDRHIIHELCEDPFKGSIVKFIVAFCKEHGILCVGEGIETKEELELIVKLGVDAGQGYYLCKPTSRIELAEINNRILSLNSVP